MVCVTPLIFCQNEFPCPHTRIFLVSLPSLSVSLELESVLCVAAWGTLRTEGALLPHT